MDQWELNMGFLQNLTNKDFANKMAEHYHTHIGTAEFKSIRDEATPGADKFNQPFIQRGIQDGAGIPSSNIDFFTAPEIDTKRISRFMGSKKGLLFIATQTGLQLSNPKGEFATTPLHGNRIYNPLATIGQIVLGAGGIHSDRHALGPLNPKAMNYEKRIGLKNNPPGLSTKNRLVNIATKLELGYFRDLTTIPKGGLTDTSGMTLLQAAPIILKESNFYLGGPKNIAAMSGLSGPHSLFGIGRTNHRTSTETGLSGLYHIHYKPGSSYKDVRSENGEYVGAIGPLIDEQKDKFLPTKTSNENEPSALVKYKTLEYGGIVKEPSERQIAGTMRHFSTGIRYGNNNSYARLGLINYGLSTGSQDDMYGEENNEDTDYVTLMFQGKINGVSDQELKFRSYGLGSITDNTSFSWSEVKYSGRTMAQHKLGEVSRDVSHDLMIVAFTPGELKQNYNKLNKLYQMASPSVDNDGKASSPFCKFTLGDLYTKVNVIIDKITFTIDESTSWDINHADAGYENTDTAGAELPMVIKLNLGYKMLTNADGGFFTNSSKFWKTFDNE